MDPMDETLASYCSECDREFAFYGLLEKHREEVHDADNKDQQQAILCEVCNSQFRRKMNYIIHWRSTAHRETKLIGCDVCDAFNVINGFLSEERLIEHTHRIHGEGTLINAKDQTEFLCPLCQKKFTHRKGMIEHLQVLHGEHLYGDLLGEKGIVKQQLLMRLLFSCNDCDKSFRVKSTLNRHREKFHNDFSHWNRNNSESSPNMLMKPKIKSDLQTQAKEDTTCRFCQKTFTRSSLVSVHMDMVHKQELELECQVENNLIVERKRKASSEDISSKSKAARSGTDSPETENAVDKSDETSSSEGTTLEKSFQELSHYPPYEASTVKTDRVDNAEECPEETCLRKFSSFFSMMRHVAFVHRTEKTLQLMKIIPESKENPLLNIP